MTKVTCCNNCPFYNDGNHGSGSPMCLNPQDPFYLKKGYGKIIDNSDIVPSWCDLRRFDYVQKKVINTHVSLNLKAPNKGG